MEISQWQTITREERYFTSVLHHELINDRAPFSDLLRSCLQLDHGFFIDDIGFEVCHFRDGYRGGVIERHKILEKQTFDFMFFLSDGSAAIVEAKAQQGFSNDQLTALKKAKDLIEHSKKRPMPIHLVGLCSSRYKPKKETVNKFEGRLIFWSKLADKYPKSSAIFKRADDIYFEESLSKL
jgi:hypothetical protein